MKPILERAWVHEGIQCACFRNPEMGHLCGYAMVPEGHPWDGIDYNDIENVEVHGGLTFSERVADDWGFPMPGWWIGFDCAHLYDHVPAMGFMKALAGFDVRDSTDKYWTVNDVEDEANRMAEQIKAASNG